MRRFSGPVRIYYKKTISEKVFAIELDCPEIAGVARPGNFVQLKLIDDKNSLWPRPFSIHHAAGNLITITIKKYGKTTALIDRLSKGDAMLVTGPLGNSFNDPPRDAPIYLVAGGVGLPPIHFLCENLLKSGYPAGSIKFYSGARTADELLGNDEIEALGVDYIVATDDGSLGIKGYITEPVAVDITTYRTKNPGRAPVVYSCGPMVMMQKLAEVCYGLTCYLSLEQLMPCGWGVCNGCAIKIKSRCNDKTEDERGFRLARVCREGPIFAASEVLWK